MVKEAALLLTIVKLVNKKRMSEGVKNLDG